MSETFTLPYSIQMLTKRLFSFCQTTANTGKPVIVLSVCKEISNNTILDINKFSLPVFHIT